MYERMLTRVLISSSLLVIACQPASNSFEGAKFNNDAIGVHTNDYPWVRQLLVEKENGYKTTGTCWVIAPHACITAAHVIEDSKDIFILNSQYLNGEFDIEQTLNGFKNSALPDLIRQGKMVVSHAHDTHPAYSCTSAEELQKEKEKGKTIYYNGRSSSSLNEARNDVAYDIGIVYTQTSLAVFNPFSPSSSPDPQAVYAHLGFDGSDGRRIKHLSLNPVNLL